MTAPAWSDHIVEDGPVSGVAGLSLGWLEQLRKVMAERDHERARAKQWKVGAKEMRRIVGHWMAWGELRDAENDQLRAALTAIRDRCYGATNPAAMDAGEWAATALGGVRDEPKHGS